MNDAISKVYSDFLQGLKTGNRRLCSGIVQDLLDEVEVEDLYFDLLQTALYEIGSLWETNQISVASEHMATAIVEGILNQIFPQLDGAESIGKKLVMACAQNEHHQVGPKIIADYFEYKGWQTYFIGADTPTSELVRSVAEIKPDVMGLSVSIAFNVDDLLQAVNALTQEFAHLEIIVGGRGLEFTNLDAFKEYSQVRLLMSLSDTKAYLAGK
jgi:MerR family transcriptional regulator, light-induced transcriptional regulator